MSSKEDLLLNHILEIKEDIAEIKADLFHHVKRTDIAEENLKILRAELKPVEKHVERVTGAIKLLSGILVVAAVVKVFIEFL